MGAGEGLAALDVEDQWGLMSQPQDLLAAGDLAIEGDAALFGELLGLLDPPDPNFAIVTP